MLHCGSGSHSQKFSLELPTSAFSKICKHLPVLNLSLLKIGKVLSFATCNKTMTDMSTLTLFFLLLGILFVQL